MIALLLALAACGEATSSALAVMTPFEGEDVTCPVNLDGERIGESGDPFEAGEGAHTVTVGDLETTTEDGQPICTSSIYGKLVRPSTMIVIDEEKKGGTITARLNLFLDGTWTCQNSLGESVTDKVSFLGGQFLSMPGVMLDMPISGRTATYEDETVTIQGVLESEERATFDLENAGGDIWTMSCHKNP